MAAAGFINALCKGEKRMWLIIGIVLVVGWILGFTVFHVAAFAIHILLILAVISIILHFVMGARARV